MIKALSRAEPTKHLDDPSFEYIPAVHTTTETIYGKATRETLKLYNENGEVIEECLIYYPRVVV